MVLAKTGPWKFVIVYMINWYILQLRIPPQLARNTPNYLNCCSSVVFSVITTYFVTCHALSTPHLDKLFTINLPTTGQKV